MDADLRSGEHSIPPLTRRAAARAGSYEAARIERTTPDPLQPGLEPCAVRLEGVSDLRHIRNDCALQGGLHFRSRNIGLVHQEAHVVPILRIHPHHLRQNQIRGARTPQREMAKAHLRKRYGFFQPIRRQDDLPILEQMREIESRSAEFRIRFLLRRPEIVIRLDPQQVPRRQDRIDVQVA